MHVQDTNTRAILSSIGHELGQFHQRQWTGRKMVRLLLGVKYLVVTNLKHYGTF